MHTLTVAAILLTIITIATAQYMAPKRIALPVSGFMVTDKMIHVASNASIVNINLNGYVQREYNTQIPLRSIDAYNDTVVVLGWYGQIQLFRLENTNYVKIMSTNALPRTYICILNMYDSTIVTVSHNDTYSIVTKYNYDATISSQYTINAYIYHVIIHGDGNEIMDTSGINTGSPTLIYIANKEGSISMINTKIEFSPSGLTQNSTHIIVGGDSLFFVTYQEPYIMTNVDEGTKMWIGSPEIIPGYIAYMTYVNVSSYYTQFVDYNGNKMFMVPYGKTVPTNHCYIKFASDYSLVASIDNELVIWRPSTSFKNRIGRGNVFTN